MKFVPGHPSGAHVSLRGDGQPLHFVCLAVQIASLSDDLHELIRWMVYGEETPRPLASRPPIAQWLAMYRRHRVVQDGVVGGLGLFDDIQASEALDEARAFSRAPAEERAAEIAQWSQEEQRALLSMLVGVPFPPDDATLRAMLNELEQQAGPDGLVIDEALDAFMPTAAAQFFFRVWWPCLVLYRDYPPRLLRAARQGDLDALDRLLRIDKYVVQDPGVARLIADVMSSGPANDKKRILNAIEGRPTVKLTDANLRAGLGALISQLAIGFGTRVTAPQIQALFDGIERVRSGRLSDPAISATGESWSKAIQRGRTWPSFPTTPPGQ